MSERDDAQDASTPRVPAKAEATPDLETQAAELAIMRAADNATKRREVADFDPSLESQRRRARTSASAAPPKARAFLQQSERPH